MSEHPPFRFRINITISYGYLDHFLFSHMHHLKVDSIFRGVLVTLRTYAEHIVPQVQKHKCFILKFIELGSIIELNSSNLIIMYKIQYIHLFPTINFDMFDRKHKMDMKY